MLMFSVHCRRKSIRKGPGMKFSWDEKRFTEIEEDWTISKVLLCFSVKGKLLELIYFYSIATIDLLRRLTQRLFLIKNKTILTRFL
jgi:hypothetical protein